MHRTPTGPAGRAMTTPTSMPFSKKPSSIPASPPKRGAVSVNAGYAATRNAPRFFQLVILWVEGPRDDKLRAPRWTSERVLPDLSPYRSRESRYAGKGDLREVGYE